jgi:hypothetical protein
MNRWHIIKEQNKSPKNNEERYLLALSLIRQGQLSQAKSVISDGDSHFRQDPKQQLLLAEIHIKEKKYGTARRILKNIERTCSDSHLKSTWNLLYRRLNHPHKEQHPKTVDEWVRLLSIKPSNDINLKANKWAIKHEHQNLKDVTIKNILGSSKTNSYHLYCLWTNLQANPKEWPFLIDQVLPLATQKNPQPDLLWKLWAKHCPNSQKIILKRQMNHLLKTSPNWLLEEVYNSL